MHFSEFIHIIDYSSLFRTSSGAPLYFTKAMLRTSVGLTVEQFFILAVDLINMPGELVEGIFAS